MQKNRIMQFAQSLILLPFISGTVATNGILPIKANTETSIIKTVFTQKENMEATGLFALNQDIIQDAKELKIKADAIDTYFKKRGMPLAGHGMKFVTEAEKNNLDWRLVAAVAVRESTGGKFACKGASYNPFGWGSCKIGFDSWDHAIETVARNLGGNNPNTAYHYADKDLIGILQAYNPPSIVARYAHQVIAIMNAIGDEEVTIPENA